MNIVAFSADQVRRLTELSAAQLRYWDETGFFHPAYAAGARAFGRVYSFRDVVGLRTIAILRGRVSLQELRIVGEELAKHSEAPWSSLSLYVLGRHVFFRQPDTGALLDAHGSHQIAMEVALEKIARDVSKKASALAERKKSDLGRVVQNRYVMHNAPVLSGTRVPTRAIWNLREAGYPRLTAADIDKATAFERKRTKSRRAS
jgi:DNA-binding transcriptional MerR regulator